MAEDVTRHLLQLVERQFVTQREAGQRCESALGEHRQPQHRGAIGVVRLTELLLGPQTFLGDFGLLLMHAPQLRKPDRIAIFLLLKALRQIHQELRQQGIHAPLLHGLRLQPGGHEADRSQPPLEGNLGARVALLLPEALDEMRHLARRDALEAAGGSSGIAVCEEDGGTCASLPGLRVQLRGGLIPR